MIACVVGVVDRHIYSDPKVSLSQADQTLRLVNHYEEDEEKEGWGWINVL